ncbi:MAG: hypothetical protein H7296_12165 [Bacteroidia bacterium]|nr:hypothetical protein [Bacteroidia bacterium]
MLRSFLVVLFISVFFISCQKEPVIIPVEKAGINWVGNWNRDSLVTMETSATGTEIIRIENDGVFTFNGDSTSGILTQGSNQYAISWLYNKAANTLTISEPGWLNQIYSINQLRVDILILTGTKNGRSGDKSVRNLYLRRK